MFFKKIILALHVYALFSYFSYSFASELDIPKLDTPEKKLQFLIYIKRDIPQVFSDIGAFGNDLFELLDNQEELKKIMIAVDGYEEEMKKREKSAQNLHIRPTGDNFVEVLTTSPKSLKDFKNELKEIAIANNLLDKPLTQISKAISNSIDKLIKIRSNFPVKIESMFGALMGSIAHDIKQDIPKNGTFSEKIAFIRTKGGDKKLSSNFDAVRAGFSKSEAVKIKTVRDLVDRIESANDTEIKLIKLLKLDLFVSSVKAKDENLENSIKKLKRGNLDYFMDKNEVISPYVAEKIEGELKVRLIDLVGQEIKKHTAFDQIETQKIAEVNLKQMPAYAGALKSCSTKDCSSEQSFAAPYAPSERNYYVYDKDSRLKGVLTSRLVEYKGKKHLYIATIAGSRISGEDVVTIVDGIYQNRSKIGIEGVILPEFDKISSMVNQLVPKEAMESLAKKSPTLTEDIVFVDYKYRQVIDNFQKNNYGEYDKMAYNKRGHLYPGLKKLKNKIELETTEVASFTLKKKDLPKLTKQEVVKAALEFQSAGLDKTLRVTLKSINTSDEKIEKLKEVLSNNVKPLDTDLFLVEIEKLLLDMTGEKISIRELEKVSPHLFYEGRLNAPDAWSSKNKKENLKVFLMSLKSGKNFAFEVIKNNRSFLNDSEIRSMVIESIIQGNARALALIKTDLTLIENKKVRDAVVEKIEDKNADAIRSVENVLLSPGNNKIKNEILNLIEIGNADAIAASEKLILGGKNHKFNEAFIHALGWEYEGTEKIAEKILGSTGNQKMKKIIVQSIKDSELSDFVIKGIESSNYQNTKKVMLDLIKNGHEAVISDYEKHIFLHGDKVMKDAILDLIKDGSTIPDWTIKKLIKLADSGKKSAAEILKEHNKNLNLLKSEVKSPNNQISFKDAHKKLLALYEKKGTDKNIKVNVELLNKTDFENKFGKEVAAKTIFDAKTNTLKIFFQDLGGGKIYREAYIEEAGHFKQFRKHPMRAAAKREVFLENALKTKNTQNSATSIDVANNISFAKGFGRFVVAQGLKDTFFFTIDAANGESSTEQFFESMANLGSAQNLVGYSAFAATATPFNKVEMRLRQKGGFKNTTKAIGMHSIGMALGMQADHIMRLTMEKAKEKALKDPSKGALRYTAEALNEAFIEVAHELAKNPDVLTATVGSFAIAGGIVKKAAKAKKILAIAKTAGRGLGKSGGFVGAAITEAAIFVVADIGIAAYLNLKTDREFKKEASKISERIGKLREQLNAENASKVFKKIHENFNELRSLRRAWLLQRDKKVSYAYQKYMEEIDELEGLHALMSYRTNRGEITRETNSVELQHCIKKLDEKKINLHDFKCVADNADNSWSVKLLNRRNSGVYFCQHLAMVKKISNQIKALEKRRVAFETEFKSSENNKTNLFTEDEAVTARVYTPGITKCRGTKLACKKTFSNVIDATTKDLYELEQKYLLETLEKVNLSVKKVGYARVIASKDNARTPSDSQWKVQNAYMQTQNEAMKAEWIFSAATVKKSIATSKERFIEATKLTHRAEKEIKKITFDAFHILTKTNLTKDLEQNDKRSCFGEMVDKQKNEKEKLIYNNNLVPTVFEAVMRDTNLWSSVGEKYQEDARDGTKLSKQNLCESRIAHCATAKVLGVFDFKSIKSLGESESCEDYLNSLSTAEQSKLNEDLLPFTREYTSYINE